MAVIEFESDCSRHQQAGMRNGQQRQQCAVDLGGELEASLLIPMLKIEGWAVGRFSGVG